MKFLKRLNKIIINYSGILVVLLVILALLCMFFSQPREEFIPGKVGPVHPPMLTPKTSVEMGIPHSQCTVENDCFPGSYLRTETYHNVCPPKYGLLNREPTPLVDDCQRNLGSPAEAQVIAPATKFNCSVDEHLRRHCQWN